MLTFALQQITGTGDLTSLNIASGDEGGEVSSFWRANHVDHQLILYAPPA